VARTRRTRRRCWARAAAPANVPEPPVYRKLRDVRRFSDQLSSPGTQLGAGERRLASGVLVLIVLVALLNLFGDEGTVDGLLRIIEELAPGSAAETFEGVARNALEGSGAGFALLIGLAISLYSASNYIGAFNRAANDIYGVQETRPFWRTLPARWP
jgi:hypothetical protein